MSAHPPPAALDALRQKIATLEGGGGAPQAALPFGIPDLDRRLPKGGLAVGCLHEVAGGGNGAAAACFAAGIVARLPGQVLWCVTQADLFPPALNRPACRPVG